MATVIMIIIVTNTRCAIPCAIIMVAIMNNYVVQAIQ